MPFTSSARPATVFTSLFLVSAPVTAQGTSEERSGCIGDAFRFCASDIPDVPKNEACPDSKKVRCRRPARRSSSIRRPGTRKMKLRREHFR
jgi:hypothetical protein